MYYITRTSTRYLFFWEGRGRLKIREAVGFNELVVEKGETERANSKTGSDTGLCDWHWSNIPHRDCRVEKRRVCSGKKLKS